MSMNVKRGSKKTPSLAMLPEHCISEIISLTSPSQAAALSITSKSFKAAADSDTVWRKFLPSDYQDIVSKSTSNVPHASLKELFCQLCNSHSILNGGNMSFALDKRSGKKSYLIGARQLVISWGETPWCWEFKPHFNSRFPEVAQLSGVAWLDIRGKIGMELLSPSTDYAAYFVFQLSEWRYGLGSVYAGIRLVNEETDVDFEKRAVEVDLQAEVDSENKDGWGRTLPRRRGDGWLEVEMGDFSNDKGGGGEAEARLLEIWCLDGKCGLIVEGIEFRPK